MPATFTVTRSLDIRAPADRIFPHVADFNAWRAWSPYEKRDPAMKRRLSGASSGVGAVYEWNGNRNVGQGRMELLESAPPSRLRIDLQFLKPVKAHNVAEFTFDPHGDSTTVTWAMHGPVTFLSRVMGLFMNMDKMIGKDFEAGLQNLRAIAGK
jgi:hypothetical protein